MNSSLLIITNLTRKQFLPHLSLFPKVFVLLQASCSCDVFFLSALRFVFPAAVAIGACFLACPRISLVLKNLLSPRFFLRGWTFLAVATQPRHSNWYFGFQFSALDATEFYCHLQFLYPKATKPSLFDCGFTPRETTAFKLSKLFFFLYCFVYFLLFLNWFLKFFFQNDFKIQKFLPQQK